jgi:hypothetical protein
MSIKDLDVYPEGYDPDCGYCDERGDDCRCKEKKMSKEGFKSMLVRVNNGVSKSSAAGVEQFWNAVNRAKLEGVDNVRFEGKDYALIYQYAKACAKAAGIIND